VGSLWGRMKEKIVSALYTERGKAKGSDIEKKYKREGLPLIGRGKDKTRKASEDEALGGGGTDSGGTLSDRSDSERKTCLKTDGGAKWFREKRREWRNLFMVRQRSGSEWEGASQSHGNGESRDERKT